MKHIKLICNLLLLLTAMIWGAAFVAQSVGMDYVGPWTFVFFRYLLSTVVLIPVSLLTDKHMQGQPLSKPSGGYLLGGLVCGLFLGLASIAQQIGMQYTTAGKAGFITTLYVILVPILSLFFGKRPEKKIWISALLGLSGLYLISIKEGFRIEKGDALVILCAFLFACQILSVAHFSEKLPNPVRLANMQFFTVTIISLIGMLLFERPDLSDVYAALVPILYAGICSGAIAYTLQVVAQKYTDPTIASLLMSLEAVFSALTGWLILGQILSPREAAGCGLVFLAVIISQVSWAGCRPDTGQAPEL
ncbi:MAG: DMT family transporter [Lachnospiraceae bacterium]|nr:DMT family transporter [Lachnospiraceae bacterium]